MSTHFKSDVKDVVVGYRLSKIEKKFQSFLEKLKDAGAKMVFTFKKTQSKELDHCKDQDDSYKKSFELIEKMRATNDLMELSLQSDRLPFNHAVAFVLCQVAEKFGELHGMDTINIRSSTFEVELAKQYKAMAIIGLDTYYTFYEGSWLFWSDQDLNIDEMTIRQINKENVLDYMNLIPKKAPLFVALAGGLYSSEINVEKVRKYLSPNKERLVNVARFVNKQTFPLSENSLRGIVTNIFGFCPENVVEHFQKTIDSMSLGGKKKVLSKVDNAIMKLIKND